MGTDTSLTSHVSRKAFLMELSPHSEGPSLLRMEAPPRRYDSLGLFGISLRMP